MTILNVVVEERYALVAADTKIDMSFGHSASPAARKADVHAGKFFPLIHMNAVLAGRGSLGPLAGVYVWCNASGLDDFDELAEGLPEVCRAFFKYCSEAATAASGATPAPGLGLDGDEGLVLIGHSRSRGRMICCRFKAAGDSFERVDELRGFFSPWPAQMGAVPANVRDSAGVVKIAKEQVRVARELASPEAGFGGRLIIAQLTAARMTIEARKLDNSADSV